MPLNPLFQPELTVCPTCQGWGIINREKEQLTCPICKGRGVWVLNQSNNNVIALEFSEWLIPHSDNSKALKTLILAYYYISFTGFAILGLTLITTALKNIDPTNLLFGSSTNTLFGFAGVNYIFSRYLAYRNQFINNQTKTITESVISKSKKNNLEIKINNESRRIINMINSCAKYADLLHRQYIDEYVLIYALLNDTRIENVLARLEVSSSELRQSFTQNYKSDFSNLGQPYIMTPLAREYIYQGLLCAIEDEAVSFNPEHILMAYLNSQNLNPQLSKFLTDFNIDFHKLDAITNWFDRDEQYWFSLKEFGSKHAVVGQSQMNKSWTAKPSSLLYNLGKDLTYLSSHNYLPSSETRKEAVKSLIERLSSDKPKSNIQAAKGTKPELIIYSLVKNILLGQTPKKLQDMRIIELSVSQLIKNNANFSQNLRLIFEEVISAGNIILYLPDFNLIGSSLDESNSSAYILDLLNNPRLKLITCMTVDEYHLFIENDPALKGIFEIIKLKPTDNKETLIYLEENVANLEHKHECSISYPTLEYCADVSGKYISELENPERAMDLLQKVIVNLSTRDIHFIQKDDLEKYIDLNKQSKLLDKVDINIDPTDYVTTLSTEIIGQKLAINALNTALLRIKAGLTDDDRPLASFLFLGPTGVGKTHTAHILSKLLLSPGSKTIQLDMTEYNDNTALSRLIGKKDDNVYRQSSNGFLVNEIKDHPESLIVLDEFEKASSEVMNLFLQILEEGKITDSNGKVAMFNKCLIIATSNAGSKEIAQLIGKNVNGATELSGETIHNIAEQYFRPELINRFDAVVPYRPLEFTEIEQVADLMMRDVVNKLKDKNIDLTYEPAVLKYIAENGYDKVYGARPIRRFIQDRIESVLATKMLNGSLTSGGSLLLTADMIK